MKAAIEKTRGLLVQGQAYFTHTDETVLREPITTGKWSRKQILGHLVDSALNNLQRFTEISTKPQPYIYREYAQNELVELNAYQEMPTEELLALWLALNWQIIRVMEHQTEQRLSLEILFTDGSKTDLRFIMHDYPEHMEHHFRQILAVDVV